MAAGLLVFANNSTVNIANAAEPLKITGPDGQVRQTSSQYGPTRSSDTFWSIAQKSRPDSSVTIYQVMAAIYDANPHAFSSDNYNSLERGMILLIPSKEVMLQIPASLAKKRAERDDKGWKAAQTNTTPAVTTTEPAEPASTSPVPPTPTQLPEVVDNSAELAEVTKQLELAQQKNLQLTDELARAQDQLDVGGADTQSLKEQIEQQDVRIQELEEALQLQKEQQASLVTENQMLQEQIDKLQVQAVEEPKNLWRTVMDNPLYLVLGALVPGLLLLLLIWLLLKKRKDNAESEDAQEQDSDKPLESEAPAAVADSEPVAAEADESAMAVHLDNEEDESIDSLMKVDDNVLQPEADMVDDSSQVDMAEEMFVDGGDNAATEEEGDEGQSLDDLWAEAMGEQEEEESKTETVPQEDDLDALLADLDTPAAPAEVEEDALDTLQAATLEADALESDALESDSLETEFPEQADEQEAASEDLDALLAEFEEPKSQSDEPDSMVSDDEQDLDSLLAEFDEPKAEDSAELDTEQSDVDSSEDLDSLLAEFDESVDTANEAQDAPQAGVELEENTQALTAIDSEIDETELLQQDEVLSDDKVQDSPHETVAGDEQLDELLAEFEQPSPEATDVDDVLAEEQSAAEITPEVQELAPSVDTPSEDLTDAIAAELEDDLPANDTDAQLDELLAEFDKPAEETPPAPELDKEVGDAIAAELDGELASDDTELDDLLAEFDIDADALDIEEESDSNFADLAKPGSGEENPAADSDVASSDPALDALLADLESVEPQANQTDSGIFDDLKSDKSPSDNSLDWDGDAGLDFESFSNSKQTAVEDSQADGDDVDAFSIDDDKLTVDEALAALEADSEPAAQAVSEHDLTSFQNDNGFIDIDKLLNDADEETVEVDQYKELDVDMGEIDNLMGNASMVDVDDEENSVNAKLDLARAYIEIDDNDSAKALLREVELDGNERQKEEAAKLINDLN